MRIIALLVVPAMVLACDTTTTQPPAEAVWEGTLQGQPGFAGVSGTATATVSGGQTTVTATITGDEPGAVRPWHIHFGTCADDQGIVGDAVAYPHLQPGADGEATQTATITFALQTGQPYFVNVHASPQDTGTIVACGQLADPGFSPGPAPGSGHDGDDY